jgi:hypothetical protein
MKKFSGFTISFAIGVIHLAGCPIVAEPGLCSYRGYPQILPDDVAPKKNGADDSTPLG